MTNLGRTTERIKPLAFSLVIVIITIAVALYMFHTDDAGMAVVCGLITTAIPLTVDAIDRLARSLEAKVSRECILEPKVDPSVLGGVVLHMGDYVVDGSVRTALDDLRKQLLKRRREGGAVLLVSEDLEEIFELCDRIAVMFQGEFMGILNSDDPRLNDIGLMMAGSLRL